MVFSIDTIEALCQTRDRLSLLESLPYIEREFVDPTPSSIPLMELADMEDVYFARYSDLEELAAVYDVSVHEAAKEVRDANLLPSNRFVVAMEEWRPLLNPSIVDEFPNVILIKEQGSSSIPYRFCETCLDPYIETQNPVYLELYLEGVSNEGFPEWFLSEAWDGFKGDLASMKATRDRFYAARKQASDIANNSSLPMAQRQKATQDMVAIDRSIQSFDDAIAAREKLQSNRKASQQGAIALTQKHGREADHPSNGLLTPEQQKAKIAELKAKRYDQMKNGTQPTATSQPQQQPEQQGWWARHWSAFKNWMDNLGNSGDQKSTWFSNMINKVKAKFNGGAQTTQASNQQQGQTQPTSQAGQPSSQQQPTQNGASDSKAQSNQSASGSNRSMVTDAIVDMSAQKLMDVGSTAIDKVASGVNNFAQDKLDIDVSDLTAMASMIGKQVMGAKVNQGAEAVKDRGVEAVVDLGRQAISKAKDSAPPVVKAAVAGLKSANGNSNNG